MSSLFDLTGKVALITGSSKGIGRAIAERMAEHGAKVVVSSRKKEACEEVAAGIVSKGGEAIVLPANIGHKEQLQGLVRDTIAHWGGIDILVCNAAVNPYFGPSINCPDEAFDRIMGSQRSVQFLAVQHGAAADGGARRRDDHRDQLDRRVAGGRRRSAPTASARRRTRPSCATWRWSGA